MLWLVHDPDPTPRAPDSRPALDLGSLSERDAASRDLWVKNPIDFLRGRPTPIAAGVVRPRTTEEVAQWVREAGAQGRSLVPLGAGSGVCGGVRPGERDVVLDLKALDRVEVRPHESVIVCGAGVMGRHAEEAANRAGFTIGHFPSSIACSSVGGWVAARGAGQLSSRYGKIEDMCLGLTAVRADGEVRRLWRGSQALHEQIGCEGALGVITEVVLRVRPLRQGWTFCGFMANDLDQGLLAARQIVRQRPVPSLIRLYDPIDSRIALSHGSGTLMRHLDHLLTAPRLARWGGDKLMKQCLLVVGWEGADPARQAVSTAVQAIGAAMEMKNLGPGPGELWLARRHDVSFKQISVVRGGHFADTMEVACPWTDVARVYHEVRAAVAPEALSMAHFSHAYSEGGAIYFSMIGRVPAYERTWQRAMDAVDRSGATLSHHHGVGRLKAELLPRELGGVHRVLIDCKRDWDPQTLFNPGVLGLGGGPRPTEPEPAEPHRRRAGLDRANGLWTGDARARLGEVEAVARAAGWTLGVPVAAMQRVLGWLREDLVCAGATSLGSARDRLVALEGVLDDEETTPFGTRVAPRTAVGPDLLPRLLTCGADIGQVTLRLVRRPQQWTHLRHECEAPLAVAQALVVGDHAPWAVQIQGRRVDVWMAAETPAERLLADAVVWPGERLTQQSKLLGGLRDSAQRDEAFEALHHAVWRPFAELDGAHVVGLGPGGGWQVQDGPVAPPDQAGETAPAEEVP